MTHGDPTNPKKNPNPVKRYEVTATVDAPGSWDSVKGHIAYEVVNRECVPRGSFTGGQNVPNVGHDFEMTRVDGNTWKGYFYRDALRDEDYFGLGICHWDATGVTPIFTTHGETFGAATWLQDALAKGPQTEYFKKSEFLDKSLSGDGALDFSEKNPEYIKDPGAFFPIIVTVKEVTP
ncbi:hypothetical protein [Rhodanobacter sp. DHG33]|uniref:hypothetical protein n=1 Tax=Rhodanobacter sp. DHG33 TaxID=2775921 RepID=UPI00177AD704|nr:hypothetical protein [Rhodanobacter sp. DHG33]MBD8899989.1 hypothetical protein [Rhodanobacter sp. DHG33]